MYLEVYAPEADNGLGKGGTNLPTEIEHTSLNHCQLMQGQPPQFVWELTSCSPEMAMSATFPQWTGSLSSPFAASHEYVYKHKTHLGKQLCRKFLQNNYLETVDLWDIWHCIYNSAKLWGNWYTYVP